MEQDPPLTRRQRREQRRQEKETMHHQAQNSKKTWQWIVGIVVIAAVGFGIWKLRSNTPTSAPTNPLAMVSDDWVEGNASATVTLVEYGDFQCPACGAYYPLVKQLSEEFKDQLRIVFRHFPLTQIHPNAMASARAAEAAGSQGKFWEMHDALFENQKAWSTETNPASTFESYATKIGLNVDQFKKDRGSKEVDAKIDRDRSSGNTLGVQGTPTFFLNGQKLKNPPDLGAFKALIQAAISQSAPPPEDTTKKAVHEHSDIKIVVNGKPLDLTAARFQSTHERELDPAIHLHDGNGEVLHKHAEGVTVGQWLKSVGMELAATCLTISEKEKACASGATTLKFNVNGKANDKLDGYGIKDLDRIFISVGQETGAAFEEQIKSISDKACIYSEKCPERGKPPTESCVGGLGTECK